MPEQLRYLQPETFIVEHNGFNYEVIACHEYYPDESDSPDPSDAIDFTGNYLLTMLTPEGTVQTLIDRSGEEPDDNSFKKDKELFEKIIERLAP